MNISEAQNASCSLPEPGNLAKVNLSKKLVTLMLP